MNDLLGGHITMIFGAVSTAMGNIRAGTIRPLATTGETRHKDFPDLPTVAEAGLTGYSAEQRYGMLAPAGTPAPIVQKLNAALRDALNSAGQGADCQRRRGAHTGRAGGLRPRCRPRGDQMGQGHP